MAKDDDKNAPKDPFKAALEAKQQKAAKAAGAGHTDSAGKSVKSGPDVAKRVRQRRMGSA